MLQNVTLDFPRGSFTAIVGESGCGKSTLASLLMGKNTGFAGSLTLGGIPLEEISQESLLKAVAYIGHQSYLFKGTVRENLAMACPEATDEAMWAVLEQVKLADYLRQEQGLDTLLQERGANLSGGQCQRLALARGLLHEGPIYIFDEATSNMDADSENHIVSLIQALAGKKTVIMISHRLASIREADNICVLATLTVPLTGVIVYKPASTVFLLLGLVHIFTAKRKSKLGLFLPPLVIAAFASGILGIIPDEYPVVLWLHKLLSIESVFALGLHSAAYFRRKRERN